MSKRPSLYNNASLAFTTAGTQFGSCIARAKNIAAARAIREELGGSERLSENGKMLRQIGLMQEHALLGYEARVRSAYIDSVVRLAFGLSPVAPPKDTRTTPQMRQSARQFKTVTTPMLPPDARGYRGAS